MNKFDLKYRLPAEEEEYFSDELWDADPDCKHIIIDNFYGGGGIKCIKCGGWICY